MALELGLHLGKSMRLGSIISIYAGLLSFPTKSLALNTPVLYFTRSDPRSKAGEQVVSTLKRGFKDVDVIRGEGRGEDMPRGRAEWEGIMRFWGMHLGREEGWKGEGDVYEVVR